MGTRPEAIKLAPLFLALNKEKNVICKICLTSQHKSMLKNMTNLFGLKPSYDLNVMRYNQNLTELIERILKGLRKIKEKKLRTVKENQKVIFRATLKSLKEVHTSFGKIKFTAGKNPGKRMRNPQK